MVCERCGYQMSENAAICPSCGSTTPLARASAQPQPQQSGPSHPQYYRETPSYQQGYAQQPIPPGAQQQYMPPPQQPPGYNQGYGQQNYQGYMPGSINVTVINTPPQKNESALIAEVILSLFGIFGVGWLMSGETTIGAILLICSLVFYWPFVLLGTIFTLGLGLICIGPLAIGGIILNAVMLSNALKRKAAQYIVMPPPPMPMR